MKIVEISDPSSFHTEQWARELMGRDIDTHVVYVKGWYPEDSDKVMAIEGVNKSIFTSPRRMTLARYLLRHGEFRRLFRDLVNRTKFHGELEYLGPRLKDYLTEHNIDVVHAHYLHSGCLLAHASRFQPTVMSTWGSDLTDGPEKYPYYVPLMRKALEKATIVQPMSEVSADLVRSLYPVEESRMFVSSWGADTDSFRPDLETTTLRDELEIPPGPVILSFRTIEPYYRIDLVIHAFKRISSEHKDASLVIGNSGPSSEELQQLSRDLKIGDRVFFTGYLSAQRMAQLFSLADIYIQCPRSDGVSVSGMQALASGLPIIANDVGETRALLEHGVNGFLLRDSNDPTPYAEALKMILDNQDMLRQMSIESRRLAEGKHNRSKFFDKCVVLFRALSQGATEMESIF